MTDRHQRIAELRRQLAALEAEERVASSAPDAIVASSPTTVAGNTPHPLLIAGGLAVLALGVIGLSQCQQDQTPVVETPPPAVAPVAASAARETTPAPNPSLWTYESSVDPLTDKKSRLACVRSTNQIQLQPPYEDVTAELCVRDDPRLGNDVFVRLLGDGQMLYRSYETGRVSVRFGEKPAVRYSAIGAADGSSNIVFISPRARFETAMKSADTTLVEAEFYRAGNQVMRFPTRDFAWPNTTTAP